MLNLSRYEENKSSCFHSLTFNPWMEIAGKYIEMSTRSPKLNRHKVSLKSRGTEAKYVLDCSQRSVGMSTFDGIAPVIVDWSEPRQDINCWLLQWQTYRAKFLVWFCSLRGTALRHQSTIMAEFFNNLPCFVWVLYMYTDQMSSTLFDLQSKQTLQLTVWREIVIYSS